MEITIPYTPRPLQKLLHESLQRFSVIVCHRRFGKTVFCINEIIQKALLNKKRRPQYAYIAPTMKQAKLIAWDYVKQYTRNIPHMKYNESELKCEFPNGAKVLVLGAENPDSLRGLYLDGVILDEVAQMPQSVWGQVIRPALADRKGWAIFIGTPKGQNYFYYLYKHASRDLKWFSLVLKASETNILDAEELDALRGELSEEEYDQELECSFTAAVQGTYYGKIMEQLEKGNQLRVVPWEASTPVVTAWDLGINDMTCIWFVQQCAGEIRVIDYHEDSGEPLTHYAKIIKEKPYVYDYHVLPHDAKQRSLSTGKTRVEQLRSLGLKCTIARKLGVKDGINAVKSLLPSCYFDQEKCDRGLIALRNYRSSYNDVLGTFSEIPLHDKFSHAADAFRYLAISLKKSRGYADYIDKDLFKSKIKQENKYDPFNF